jgi:hypothetical protein
VEGRPHLPVDDSALKKYLAAPCDFGIGSEWDCQTKIRKEAVVEQAVDWAVEENAEDAVVHYPPSLVVDSLLEEGGVSRSDSPAVVDHPPFLVVDSLVLRSLLEERGVSRSGSPSVVGHHPYLVVGSLVLRNLLEEGGVSRSKSPSVLGQIHWDFVKRQEDFRSTANCRALATKKLGIQRQTPCVFPSMTFFGVATLLSIGRFVLVSHCGSNSFSNVET